MVDEPINLLKQQLAQTEGDEHIRLLCQIAYNYHTIDPIEGQSYAETALRLAETSGSLSSLALARRIYGLVISVRGELDSAIAHIEQAVSMFKDQNDYEQLSRAYNDLGIIYGEQGDHASSLQAFFKALAICESEEDFRGIAFEYGNIGVSYEFHGNLERARHYQEMALELWQELEEPRALARTYTNLGKLLLRQSQFREALDYANQARMIWDALSLPAGNADNHQLLANIAFQMGNYTVAMSALNHARELHKKLDMKAEMARDYLLLARIMAKQEQWPEAADHVGHALHIARLVGAQQTEMDCYELQSQLYRQNERYAAALNAYERYSQIREKLFNEKSSAQIADMEARYEAEKRRAEIEEQRHEAERQRAEAEIYRLKNEELGELVEERTRELKEAYTREKAMAAQLKDALNRERDLIRLKSNIIDIVSHEFRTPLTVISSSAYMIFQHYEQLGADKRRLKYDRIDGAIKEILRLLDDALILNKIDSLEIAPTLNPVDIRALCLDISRDAQHLQEGQPRIRLESDEDTNYRVYLPADRVRDILWQLITNALKFSSPDQDVVVKLIAFPNEIVCDIIDSGIGIPPDELPHIYDSFYRASNVNAIRGLGLGLTIAREIVRLLLGELTITSEGNGRGTHASVRLPRAIVPVD